MLTLQCPSAGLLGSLPTHQNLLHELVLSSWCCSSRCGVYAWSNCNGPEMWVQADNRDPRTVGNSLMVSCWSMEKSNLESQEKTTLSLTDKEKQQEKALDPVWERNRVRITQYTAPGVQAKGWDPSPGSHILWKDRIASGELPQRSDHGAAGAVHRDLTLCTDSKDLPLHLHAWRSSVAPSPPPAWNPQGPVTGSPTIQDHKVWQRSVRGWFPQNHLTLRLTVSGVASKKFFLKADF